MAIDHKNIKAMNSYATILKKGDGIPANKEEAATYFKMAADAGDPISNWRVRNDAEKRRWNSS